MKTLLSIINIFLLALCPSFLFSQSMKSDTASFVFPLNKGDVWFYNVSNDVYPGMHFSYNTSLTLDADTTMSNGKTYYPFPSMESGTSWHEKQFLRKQGLKVYQFSPRDSNEYLRFDFSAKTGDTIGVFASDPFHGIPLEHTWYIILGDTSIFKFRNMSLRSFVFNGTIPTTEIGGCIVADTLGIVILGDGYLSQWRLIGARLDGKEYGTILSAELHESATPDGYRLYQNYPNPFNPSTTFQFSLEKSNFTSLTIYNLLGQKVATLVNERLAAGLHQVEWNANDFAGGIYFFRLQSGDFAQSKKLVILK